MFEEKNEIMSQIIDYNIGEIEEQISIIKDDKTFFGPSYDKYKQKRIQILNEINNNWRKIKILFSSSELDKVEILMSYNKLLSKYQNELAAALSQVVHRDTNTLVKSDRGPENPLKEDTTYIDGAGYKIDEFTHPLSTVKSYIDYKFDQISQKYESAISELQDGQNVEKQSGRTM